MKWPSFLKREDWRLVKTLSEKVTLKQVTGHFYFHLYESNKGARRVEITHTLPDWMVPDVKYYANLIPMYHETVYRWKHGRRDPDIPTYNHVPEDDVVNFLKSSVK